MDGGMGQASETAADNDAARKRIARFLKFQRERRTAAEVIGAIVGTHAFTRIEILKEAAAIDTKSRMSGTGHRLAGDVRPGAPRAVH